MAEIMQHVHLFVPGGLVRPHVAEHVDGTDFQVRVIAIELAACHNEYTVSGHMMSSK